MRDRIEQGLRIVVLILLGLIAWQLSQALFKANPLAKVTIPAIPTLATNSAAGVGKTNQATTGSNGVLAGKMATNGTALGGSNGTNGTKATNAISAGTNVAAGTNLGLARGPTNTLPAGSNAPAVRTVTNVETAAVTASNQPGQPVVVKPAATNVAGPEATLTATQTVAVGGTNLPAAGTNGPGTNGVVKKSKKHVGGPEGMMMAGGSFSGGFPGGFPGMGGRGGPAQKLSPEAQVRVDKIVNSEIFAPVFHPLPMALMGIAGDTAFLRGPDGQTGLVKPGDSLGEVKLVRIGINRVLVDQGGEQKELLIFDGYGGESLLSTTNGSSK